MPGRRWFTEHGVSFGRHYTGSLACVPSRPTLFTGQYPDVHGVTQTDGLGKDADDSGMRWLRPGEVPTLGHWFRAAGYDTYYQGKWHLSHADLHDAATGRSLATNDDDGDVDRCSGRSLSRCRPARPFGFSGWIGPEPHGGALANSGLRRDPLTAARVVAWLDGSLRPAASGRRRRRRGRSCSWPASSIRTTSCCSRCGLATTRSPAPTTTCPVCRRHPPPTRTSRPSRAAQAAFRAAYPTGYAPLPTDVYESAAPTSTAGSTTGCTPRSTAPSTPFAGRHRGGSDDAVIVLTADHGELLGAHGGLHQKWFNLYDEATRVPFVIARVGPRADDARARSTARHVTRRHRPDAAVGGGHRRRAVSPRNWRGGSPRSIRCPAAT